MGSIQKILIDIALVSQRVVNTLIGYAGRRTVEGLRLDKLVVGSGAVLETVNRTLLLRDDRVDDRLVDWLESEEPLACLRTLNQMEEILNRKLEYSVMNFLMASHSVRAQDKCSEAIRLFQMRQGYFHFLLTTDVWNHEDGRSSRPQAPSAHTEGAIGRGDLATLTRSKSDYVPSIPLGRVQNQGSDAKKLKTILSWLNAWNCKETHRRTVRLRQTDTCAWLPNTNAFKIWRSTEDSFLWLYGKAGAGKSVLAASIIEHLKNALKDGEILTFFYCNFRDERSTKAAEVLRSVLSQLLQHIHHYTQLAVGLEDLIDNLVKEAEDDDLISDLTLLTRHISCVAQQFDQQPFLVIDALDECKDVEELLDAIVELASGGIRLFVTSRPLQIIKDSLSGFLSISMETMKYQVQADIIRHISRELESDRRLRIMEASLKNEIYWALLDKADGMFRWVHCQLNTLKRCMTAAQIRRALDDLPTDLDATYARILLRINEYEREVVRDALYWLVAALMPLKLCQIIEGLSINPGRRVVDRDSGPVHGLALLDALGSLVTHDEITDIIVLSHASVKEYLINCTEYPIYQVDERDAHTQLALLSMCYITIYLSQSQRPGGCELSPQATCHGTTRTGGLYTPSCPIQRYRPPLPSPDSHPLLGYVQSCGFQHLEHVHSGDRKVLRAIDAFQSGVGRYPSEWEWLCRTCESHWPTLKHDLALYILTAFAPASLLSSYIGRSLLRPKDGTNPLIYAASCRKIEHAKILLSRGVSLNRRGWNVGYKRHQVLPLEVAAERWDHCMVDLFLTEGSLVPHRLFESALREHTIFPVRVLSKLLQTDEFVEWATIAWNERRFLRALDPTQYLYGDTIEEGIEAIARRLIQIGCNPSAQFDETSLRHAVRAGHISTVKRMLSLNIPLPPDIILDASTSEMMCFLLSLGSDVHVVASDGDTALHLVMNSHSPEDECLEKIEILIDAGLDPCASNLAGQTPLHIAVRIGSVSIVEYLLSLHAPLPRNILLVMAPWPSMIRRLLAEGADVHAISADGNTVLHVALSTDCCDWDQCLELAVILIDAGCSPCSPNAFGETPFDVAAKMGHLPVVQYLLSLNIPLPSGVLLSVVRSYSSNLTPMLKLLIDKGADVHVTSASGDTLLGACMESHLVGEEECLRRIKILIHAGCDVYVCNTVSETLLHVAARRRNIPVMEYLLSLDMPVPSDFIFTQFRENGSRGCYETIRLLLDKEVDIHAVAENGDTLLHLAAGVAPEEEALDLVKSLVRSGCNPYASNLEQETPFHVASQYGYTSVIDHLLSLGLSLPPDILLAASTGFFESAKSIRYLTQKGANVSVVGTDGSTPLHLLFNSGYEHDRLESARILIDAGCDPRSKNFRGETPMHLAARQGYITVLEDFLSRGIPLPHDILLTSAAETIRFLLNNGFDVQSIGANDNEHLLHYALDNFGSEEDCLERVRALVSAAGCSPSSKHFFGETPMHIAARHNYISVVKYLLSQNATLPDDILLAALQTDEYQFEYDRQSLLHLLIREGANTNATASGGDNPLHFVIRHKITSSRQDAYLVRGTLCGYMEILLNGGSDPYARNADGKTAFDLAEEKGESFKENFIRLVQNSRVHQDR